MEQTGANGSLYWRDTECGSLPSVFMRWKFVHLFLAVIFLFSYFGLDISFIEKFLEIYFKSMKLFRH